MLGPEGVAGWESLRVPEDVPMHVEEAPVAEVLAELAQAVRLTDVMFPRQEEEGYVATRALVWSRCRAHLPSLEDWEPPPALDREPIIAEFIASGAPDDATTRSLAELFLSYGEGYITAGPLCWSPQQVELFLTDWVLRKTVLDAEERERLPATLKRWVRFALGRRGVPETWIEPVIEAVDDCREEFDEAFDDDSAWGPAKMLAGELERRGVDMTDRAAVDEAVNAVNAERLARMLSEREQ